eukprot:gb/GECG01002192.1/.p1 GENE.gb/GECG01002192.1/~~gb/GECG01002192.1/.p1  ORF type:complete len:213 (+),score=29.91 gb/GECG01002192.1/:1-639(+)
MDSLIAITGDGFTLMAANSSSAFSIMNLKHDEDKIATLPPNILMGMAGAQGDYSFFRDFIQANVKYHTLRTGLDMSTKAASTFIRGEIAESLRRNPVMVQLLVGGHDKDEGGSLYFIDYLGTLQKVPYGAQGYASNFVSSVMDRYYKPNMSLQEAKDLMLKCIEQISLRFIVGQPVFNVKVVDENGIRKVDMPEANHGPASKLRAPTDAFAA